MTSNTAEFSSSAASRAAFSSARAQRHGKRRVKQDCERNKQRSRSTDYTPQAKMQIRFCILRILADFTPCTLRKRRFPFLFLTTALLSPPCSPTLHSLLLSFSFKIFRTRHECYPQCGTNADNCGYLRQNCKYLMFGLPSGAHCGII